MFFILLFNALLAMAELTAAFESRPILMKHKSLWGPPGRKWKIIVLIFSSSFYRPAAYALAQVVVDVPLVFIQVVLFDIIVYLWVYWMLKVGYTDELFSMANLARTPSQFFINLLFIFILTMTMYSFFRALGALCASLDVGKGNDPLGIKKSPITLYSHTPHWCCYTSIDCIHR